MTGYPTRLSSLARGLGLCVLLLVGVAGISTRPLCAQAGYAQDVRTLMGNLRQIWSEMLGDPVLAEIPMVAASLREVTGYFDEMEAELLAPDSPAAAMESVRLLNDMMEQLMPLMTSTGALSTSQLSSLRESISRLQSTVSSVPVSAPVEAPAERPLPDRPALNQPNCGADPTAFSAQERRRWEQYCGVPEQPDELNQPNCGTSPSTMTATERARWEAYCGVPERPPTRAPTPAWVQTPPTRSADPAAPSSEWKTEDADGVWGAVKNGWGERLRTAMVDEVNAALEPYLRNWRSLIESVQFRWNLGQNSLVLLDQALDGTQRNIGAFSRDEEYDCWRHGANLDEHEVASASKFLTVLREGRDIQECPR